MRAVSKALGAIVTVSALAGLGTAAAFAAPSAGAATAASAATASAAASTSNAGFAYGTDSWPTSVTGSGPYFEPVIGGHYSGYIGMVGNWARTEGCKTGNFLAFSTTNSAQANVNFTKYGGGIGTGAYWYMGGPGVDPHYNGTATESYKWGEYQAQAALFAMGKHTITSPVVWADIELPGIEPALDNGWNSVYSSPCSEHVIHSSIPANVDREEFDGFAAYVTAHSKDKVGVYSSASVWTSIFGTGSESLLPNTYEWTYLPETSNTSAAPSGWCLHDSSTCAQFFGGQSSSSPYAVMWQWSGGGGITNKYGFDFDQIDIARLR
jgi:hypothetical protein